MSLLRSDRQQKRTGKMRWVVDLIRGLKSNILSLHITLLLHTFEIAGIDGVEELPGRT